MLTIVFTKSDDVALQLCSHFTLKPLGRNYECNVVTKLNHSQNIWKESSYGRANNSFVTNKQLHSYFKKSAVVHIDGGTFFFTYYRRRSNSMGSIFSLCQQNQAMGVMGDFHQCLLVLIWFWKAFEMLLRWLCFEVLIKLRYEHNGIFSLAPHCSVLLLVLLRMQ